MPVYFVKNLTGGLPGDLNALGIDKNNGPSGQTLDLLNDDVAIYADGSSVEAYWFDSAGTDAQSLPDIVRPNDFSTAGVWKRAVPSILSDKALTVGSGEGSVRMRHQSTDNSFNITPYDGGSYDTAKDLLFDADTGQWAIGGAPTAGSNTILTEADENRYMNVNVDNYTALRAYSVASGIDTVFVRGYSSDNDGGAGIFEYVSGAAPATYVDNDGTIIVPTGGDGSAAWLRQYNIADGIRASWFGAVGDGTTDDEAEINKAITYLVTSGIRGDVVLSSGKTYRATDTIVVRGTGVRLRGEANGELTTIILADHSAGPAVRVKDRRSGLKDLEITASTSRNTGAAGSNYGVLVESDDVAGYRPTYGVYDNVLIKEQPNVGMLVIGGCWFTEIKQVTIRDNKSHGIQFDYGSATSRTNTENPGEVNMSLCEIFDNDGHGIVVGNNDSVSNRGFRFNFTNVDLYRNAESAGTRRSADAAWFFMDTSTIDNCAFDGSDKAETAATTRGFILHGRAVSVTNSRFLNVTAQAMRIATIGVGGYTTSGIRIGEFILLGDFQSSLYPVVTLDSDVTGISVDSSAAGFVTGYTDTSTAVDLIKKTIVVSKGTTETRNNTSTLADDTDLKIDLFARERVQYKFYILYRGDVTADIKFAVSVPSGATNWMAPTNSLKIDTADAVAVQNVITTSSAFSAGTHASNQRLVEISGEVSTNGTSGELALQWAQNSAVVGDTQVLAQSYLTILR